MCKYNIVALILAAGYSSRMGNFKPLLPLDGKPVIEWAIGGFRQAGITDIRVVVGHRADELVPVLDALEVKPIINEQYDYGMFSSVHAGIRTFDDKVEGFFLLPGDIPLVKSKTLKKMLEVYQQTENCVIYPSFLGQRGHPPLITRPCFGEIMNQPLSGNLRSVLQHFEHRACNVELIDQSILLDMDTATDYQNICSSLMRRNMPTIDECQAIFSIYNVADSVIRHGWAVANVARQIAKMLNDQGGYLDIELITVSGLLHDIAKGKPNHAQTGAVIIEQEGYPDVARVIACHMDITIDASDPGINAAMLVYLADKMISHEQLVNIKERFARVGEKFTNQPHILLKIEERMKHALIIKARIEKCLSMGDLYSILNREA